MLEQIFSLIVAYWRFAIPAILLTHLALKYFNHGLHKYPGPFLAKFTDCWRFVDVWKRRPDITQLELHRNHGAVVRLGPNTLSFSSPAAIKTIYGLNKGFTKSGFYAPQQAMSQGKRLFSLFSTADETYHAQLRRCVNNAFSMSAMVQYEPLVNEIVELFLDKTEAFFAITGEVCDFALWLQYLAFDVIGQITYGKRHGFIDDNEDIEGMVGFLGRLFSYVAPIGQMPLLDLLMMKNPIIRLLDYLGFKTFAFPITSFAKARMAERMVAKDSTKSGPAGRADLLSMFLKAQSDHPEFMTDERVLVMAVSMAFAGSETTGITLAAVFYYLLRNPACYDKVMRELQEAVSDGRIEPRPSGLVTWSESQTLPYLDACIKEAFRMHPAAGLPLERITPPQGIEIDGHWIQGGTIVGCNAWVIHKNERVFGQDVDSFIPERWLECSKEQRKEMEGTMFQFGAGSRTCIGKNISLLEVYKVVPSFLRRFEVEFADPTQDWTLHNAWFVKQLNFNTRIKSRELLEKAT